MTNFFVNQSRTKFSLVHESKQTNKQKNLLFHVGSQLKLPLDVSKGNFSESDTHTDIAS